MKFWLVPNSEYFIRWDGAGKPLQLCSHWLPAKELKNPPHRFPDATHNTVDEAEDAVLAYQEKFTRSK